MAQDNGSPAGLHPRVAKLLLDKLETDNDFRKAFVDSPEQALRSIGHTGGGSDPGATSSRDRTYRASSGDRWTAAHLSPDRSVRAPRIWSSSISIAHQSSRKPAGHGYLLTSLTRHLFSVRFQDRRETRTIRVQPVQQVDARGGAAEV